MKGNMRDTIYETIDVICSCDQFQLQNVEKPQHMQTSISFGLLQRSFHPADRRDRNAPVSVGGTVEPIGRLKDATIHFQAASSGIPPSTTYASSIDYVAKITRAPRSQQDAVATSPTDEPRPAAGPMGTPTATSTPKAQSSAKGQIPTILQNDTRCDLMDRYYVVREAPFSDFYFYGTMAWCNMTMEQCLSFCAIWLQASRSSIWPTTITHMTNITVQWSAVAQW